MLDTVKYFTWSIVSTILIFAYLIHSMTIIKHSPFSENTNDLMLITYWKWLFDKVHVDGANLFHAVMQLSTQ